MSTITDTRWRADIAVGQLAGDWSHEWTYYQNHGETADSTQVLAGLTFGWSISTSYWPAQPDAQVATFGINAPDFADVAGLAVGDPVAIKVRLYNQELSVGVDPVEIDGPTVAEFYGRITDLKAKARGERGGVTLYVTAVDYTVDLTEGLNASLKTLNPFIEAIPRIPETFLANILWTNLGGTPNTIDDLWTSADHEAAKSAIPENLSEALAAMLLSAFVYETDTKTRMIVSPVITTDGLLQDPADGRMFTLDTITRPDPNGLPDMTVDGSCLGRDIEWTQNKNLRPGIGIITATIGETEEENLVSTIATTLLEGAPAVSLTSVEVTGWDDDRYHDMAHFYLGDPANDDVWQISTVTLYPQQLLDPEDPEHDAAHQLGSDLYDLFPHWALTESTAARASGYTRRLGIVATPDSVTPYPLAAESIHGIVRGVQLTIAGGRLTFDLSLIRMRHTYEPTG